MVALAHVEAPCIGNVAEICKIDFVLGPDVAAAERGLLERDAALMALGNIDKSPAVGPEQPFVGREDYKIRVEARKVHRQHTGALRRVDQEGGSPSARRRRGLGVS